MGHLKKLTFVQTIPCGEGIIVSNIIKIMQIMDLL